MLPPMEDPNLLVGVHTGDDAAVYRLGDDVAIVQSVDFFPPVVDDPYQFGTIAAANAFSDLYAMGARPILALNLVCFPIDLDKAILGEILRGGHDKTHEAGAVIGGLIFGFGMTLCGGCGTKTLVRFGAGNLKSVVVALFLGIFAYMTLRGLLGLARIQLESRTMVDLEARGMASQAIPDALAALGLPAQAALLLTIAVIAGGMLWFCFKCPAFRDSRRDIAAGLIIGALIPAAWYVTGVIGYDDFDPVPLASLTFVSPVGESLQYLMTFTGATVNFGISVVGGVILGSFVAAKTAGEFRLEAFSDKHDMARHMVGGALMGTGGIMALGCTIGQGISGMSTLAMGSLIALLSIIGGAVLGFRYLEEGSLAAIFSARSSDS